MEVCQFWLLKIICPFAFITGLAAVTPGCCAIASASACVSDCCVPPPCLTLPALLALPGRMVNCSGLSVERRWLMLALLPSLIEIIMMTAPTPIMMPREVSRDLRILARSARDALLKLIKIAGNPRTRLYCRFPIAKGSCEDGDGLTEFDEELSDLSISGFKKLMISPSFHPIPAVASNVPAPVKAQD